MSPHPLRSAQNFPQLLSQQLRRGVHEWADLAERIADADLQDAVAAAGVALANALASGGQLLVAGNGGSSAIASHLAAEFSGKCIVDRPPLPAINLGESPTALTAIGNDYGFAEVFQRGVAAFGRPGDVFLGMSTSGKSANVLLAAAEAQERGLITILMVGGRDIAADVKVDHLLAVPSLSTPRIQEVHMLWAHAWAETIDLASQP